MSQSVPLIVQAADGAHRLNTMWDAAVADGLISPEELCQIDHLIDGVAITSLQAELAYQWGMAVMKGGLNGKRAKELEAENRVHAQQMA